MTIHTQLQTILTNAHVNGNPVVVSAGLTNEFVGNVVAYDENEFTLATKIGPIAVELDRVSNFGHLIGSNGYYIVVY